MKTQLSLLTFLCFVVLRISGHAFMEQPKYRAYFAGYSTPQGMNCGGISNQWDKYGGVCGVCGDDYGGTQNNMAGGKWATGVVVESYSQGQTIDVKIKITANHLGFFNFSLCVNNDFSRKITEECLAKHPLTIIDPDTGFEGMTWDLPRSVTQKTLQLKLPANVHCTQCVLRWYWKGGNNWGVDPFTGKGCSGCAVKQECFVNCADIEIVPNGDPVPPPLPTTPKVATTTTEAVGADCIGNMGIIPDNGKLCTAKDPNFPEAVNFCKDMCTKTTFCPARHCVCLQ